jgi:hypothetical protein
MTLASVGIIGVCSAREARIIKESVSEADVFLASMKKGAVKHECITRARADL